MEREQGRYPWLSCWSGWGSPLADMVAVVLRFPVKPEGMLNATRTSGKVLPAPSRSLRVQARVACVQVQPVPEILAPESPGCKFAASETSFETLLSPLFTIVIR